MLSPTVSKRLLVLKLTLFCLLAPLQQMVWPQSAATPKLSTQIQRLKDDKQRESARQFLQGVVAPAVEGLVEAIANPATDRDRRLSAIQILETMGGDAEMAVPVLSQVLVDRDARLRLAAVKALRAIGPKSKAAVPELIGALRDPNESVRIVTASLLSKLGLEAKPAIPALIDALGDQSQAVRIQAIDALSAMGDEATAAVPQLNQALTDTNAEVRKSAASALGRMGAAAQLAVPNLATALKDSDKAVRLRALTSLGTLGPAAAAAVPDLIQVLRGDDRELRAFAALALGNIGAAAKQAVPDLIQALADPDKDLRAKAASALGGIGAEARPALPQMIAALQDSDSGVQIRDSAAIGRIAGSLQDQAKRLKRSELDEAIAALDKAVGILASHPNTFNSEVTDAVRRSVTVLRSERQFRLFDRALELLETHPVWALLLAYGVTTPVLWSLVLWIRPLWLFHLNQCLRPYTDVHFPISSNHSISVPLRSVLFLSWFHYHPRVLDAWVRANLATAQEAFAQKSTVSDRQIYIPIPVILKGQVVAELTSSALHRIFEDGRQCLLIWGEGGIGKTSLACQLAKWAMATHPEQRLTRHPMLAVLIEQELDFKVSLDKDPLRAAVRGQLQALIDSREPISDEMLDKLLRLRRVLVIVDHLSELSPETRAAIRPGHPDFPANALIVTSRVEEPLDGVPKIAVKPLRIEGNRLSSFLDAYLLQCHKRDLFTDAEYFDACSQLSKMVGQRNITVLLAKLYAEQMIVSKEGVNDGQLPENIPDLMLSYLNELNRDRNPHEPENRTVHQVAKIVAWECLKQAYRPAPTKRGTLLVALQQQLEVEEASAIAWLDHLEKRLRILYTVGPAQDQVCFALDPLAECLAALYWVEHQGQDVASWTNWLMQADAMAGAPQSIQGFLLAMRDCCLSRSLELDIPEFVLDELGRRVGLSLETLRQAQIEQRLQRLRAKLGQGNRTEQQRTMRALAELGAAAQPVLPLLVREFANPHWQVRQEVARTIGSMGSEARSAIPALVEQLADADRRVACEAIATLGKIGSAAIPALVHALASEVAYVRSTAAWVLSRFEAGAKAAVPALIQVVHDPDWQVRWVAAYALGRIGPDAKAAIPDLIAACKGEYVLVSKEASRALWRIHGEAADSIVMALGEQAIAPLKAL
jgi:HEAT repeat protein